MPYTVIPPTGLLLGPIGSISQTDQPFTTPRQVRYADTMVLSFGEPFVLNADNTYSSVAQYIANNGVPAVLALADGSPGDPFGIAASAAITNTYYRMNGGVRMPLGLYPPGVMINGLTRGTITVAVNNGTPAGANSPVFIRTIANSSIPAGVVGLFEATPDGTIVGAANAGNTGNGTIGSLAIGPYGSDGVYSVAFADATTFGVYDEVQRWCGNGTVGVPFTGVGQTAAAPWFSGNRITFTITAGSTPFAHGDGFAVTVALNTLCVKNMVFKTGLTAVDQVTGMVAAQVTIIDRRIL